VLTVGAYLGSSKQLGTPPAQRVSRVPPILPILAPYPRSLSSLPILAPYPRYPLPHSPIPTHHAPHTNTPTCPSSPLCSCRQHGASDSTLPPWTSNEKKQLASVARSSPALSERAACSSSALSATRIDNIPLSLLFVCVCVCVTPLLHPTWLYKVAEARYLTLPCLTLPYRRSPFTTRFSVLHISHITNCRRTITVQLTVFACRSILHTCNRVEALLCKQENACARLHHCNNFE
jgi:hypothetical protein